MILACPLCNARYLVAAQVFADGPRQVRCGRCSHGWQAVLTEDGEAAPQAPSVAGEALPTVMLESSPPVWQRIPLDPKIKRVLSIGLPSAAAVVFLLWFFLDCQEIAKSAPFTETFYNFVGLTIHHYGEGLSFVKVRSELHYDAGVMKLAVEGQIRNETRYVQEIPNILASAVGSDGQIIQSWQIDAPAITVAPGGAVAFHSSINAPRTTVVDINLSLIEKQNHE